MQPTIHNTITLVLGGVRSGKSRWAQRLAQQTERVGYIATALPIDAEMQQKIRRHQQDRPAHWTVFEEPIEVANVIIDHAHHFDTLLVDCLTIFVANILIAAEHEPALNIASQPALNIASQPALNIASQLDQRIAALLHALQTAAAPVVLVSNEVGSGVVPANPLGRNYRDALGEMNQRVAAIADNVVLMIAGLPLVLKGNDGLKHPDRLNHHDGVGQ